MPLTPVTPPVLPAWAPTVDAVAALMRARLGLTGGDDGGLPGGLDATFTEETGITADMVKRNMPTPVSRVRLAIGLITMPATRPLDGDAPPRPLMQGLWDAARDCAALGTAASVERSTTPEQVQIDRGPYQAYSADFEAMLKQVAAFARAVRDEDGDDGDPTTPDGPGSALYNLCVTPFAGEGAW